MNTNHNKSSSLGLSYKDVFLIQNFSDIKSRENAIDNSTFLDKSNWSSCVIPANMKCTIDFKKAEELAMSGYFYILHRFYEYEKIFDWIKENQDLPLISISIGIKSNDFALLEKIYKNNIRVDVITIDVAHGGLGVAEDTLEYLVTLNKYHKRNVKFIVGNIMTYDIAVSLFKAGADAVKVGLSMGHSCETYDATGVGSPMFSTLLEVCEAKKLFENKYVIADGQVKSVGDVAKAVVAGADMVMVGSMFASCMDSPSDVDKDGNKIYFGSASKANGRTAYIEGGTRVMQNNGMTYNQLFEKISEGLRSTMSYAGTRHLDELKCGMKWGIHCSPIR